MIHQRQPVNQEPETYTPYLRDVQQAICSQFPIDSKDLQTLLTVDKQHNSIVCEIYRANLKSILEKYANWESPLNGIISSFIADYPNPLVLNSEIVSNIQRLITETIQGSGVFCQNRHLSVENVPRMNQALEEVNLTTMWIAIRNQLEYVIAKPAEDASAKDISTWMYLNQNHLQGIGCLNLSGIHHPSKPLTGIPKEIALLIGLEELSLRYNWISYLPREIFHGLSQLALLYINNNRINDLPVDLFKGLNNLHEIDLGNNKISTLSIGLFNHLNELYSLSLSQNKIKSLTDGIFNGTNLSRLLLEDNQIINLNRGAFEGLNRLFELTLSNNRIVNLAQGVFDSLGKLSIIDLSNNLISHLAVELFKELNELSILNLSNNKISNLYPGVFNDLNLLRDLNLSGNQISILRPGIFNGLNLFFLGLNDNQISHINQGVLNDVRFAIPLMLGLKNNKIINLLPETVNHFGNIDIAGNPQLLHNYKDFQDCRGVLGFSDPFIMDHLQIIKEFYAYSGKSLFAQFYQFVARGIPFQNVWSLNPFLKDLIYNNVYQEAGSPITPVSMPVFQWGEKHALDNMDIFKIALKKTVMMIFEQSTGEAKNAICDLVYELKEEQDPFPVQLDASINLLDWKKDHAHDHILRLIDAMSHIYSSQLA